MLARNRIARQLDGVARMIEKDRDCVDLLLQVVSARADLGELMDIFTRDSCLEKSLLI